MKNLDDLSNVDGLDESLTEDYSINSENYTDYDIANILEEEFEEYDNEEYSNFRLFGIGKESEAQKKRKAKRKEKLKKINDKLKNTKIGKFVGDKLGGGKYVHSVNKFNPVFINLRAAVLAVLKKNIVGMSDAIYLIKEDSDKSAWEEIMQKWWMWGGEKAKFDKAVMKGKGKKPLFKDIVEKFKKNKKKGFDGEYSYANAEQLGNAGDVVLVASSLLGVAATALAAGTATAPAAPYVGIAGGAFGSMGGILKGFAKKKGASEEKLNEIPETAPIPNAEPPKDAKELEKINKEIESTNEEGEKIDGDKFLGMPKAIGITVTVVGALALIVGGIFLVKKLKK